MAMMVALAMAATSLCASGAKVQIAVSSSPRSLPLRPVAGLTVKAPTNESASFSSEMTQICVISVFPA
jgi:hypothetical protein